MNARGFSSLGVARVALVCASLAGLLACDPASDQASAPATPSTHGVRIASLSPGITATIVELGAHERLVGRTPWCQSPGEVAVVGTLLDLNAEALVRARPTVVLVQPPSQGVDPAIGALAEQYGWTVTNFRIESLGDVAAMVPGIAQAIADPALAHDREKLLQRASEITARLDEVLAPLACASEIGEVLLVLISSENADAMAFGQGTYLGEFIERIGAKNVARTPGYPTLSTEALMRTSAATIIVLGGHASDVVTRLRIALPQTLILALDSPQLLQPGGGMIHGLAQLRALIAHACELRVKDAGGSP